jgi:hypothetical protein
MEVGQMAYTRHGHAIQRNHATPAEEQMLRGL